MGDADSNIQNAKFNIEDRDIIVNLELCFVLLLGDRN